MTTQRLRNLALNFATAAALSVATANAAAADQALLDILLGNGAITKAQYDELMKKPSLSSADFGAPAAAPAASAAAVETLVDRKLDEALEKKIAARMDAADEAKLDGKITDRIAAKIEEEFPVKASYTSKGFRLETRDGNWQTKSICNRPANRTTAAAQRARASSTGALRRKNGTGHRFAWVSGKSTITASVSTPRAASNSSSARSSTGSSQSTVRSARSCGVTCSRTRGPICAIGPVSIPAKAGA